MDIARIEHLDEDGEDLAALRIAGQAFSASIGSSDSREAERGCSPLASKIGRSSGSPSPRPRGSVRGGGAPAAAGSPDRIRPPGCRGDRHADDVAAALVRSLADERVVGGISGIARSAGTRGSGGLDVVGDRRPAARRWPWRRRGRTQSRGLPGVRCGSRCGHSCWPRRRASASIGVRGERVSPSAPRDLLHRADDREFVAADAGRQRGREAATASSP
jgi:hypothetical protein